MPSEPARETVERLGVPISWWLLGTALVLSIAVAVLFSLGPWWALGTLVGFGALQVLAFSAWAVSIRIDPAGVRVGRAWIEWPYVAAVTALDRDEVRDLLRRHPDPRAFLLTRPYIGGAIRIDLDDTDDPHPYWLVSSRAPRRLARAARPARVAASPDG